MRTNDIEHDGFAINQVGGGGVQLDTIRTSRRATIVSWLTTRHQIRVTAEWSDDLVEDYWQQMRREHDFCIMINVDAVLGGRANVTARPVK